MTAGTYENPVLNTDWSDPDVVRVGDDFHLTASGFGRVPGLPPLHSRDLVHRALVGHALERLEPEEESAVRRHDRGVRAPSVRHHDDRFWSFRGDPDQGVLQVNAPGVRGPWTRPHLLEAGRGPGGRPARPARRRPGGTGAHRDGDVSPGSGSPLPVRGRGPVTDPTAPPHHWIQQKRADR